MMKMENEINVTVPLEVVKASEIEPKEVKWLWYPYIPFGKVTLLQGDPGDGKSKLMLSIAALLSKGEALPFTDEEVEPMTIIYQTTEDDADDTVVPRFNSAGGNGENLIFIKEDEKSLSFGDKDKTEQRFFVTGVNCDPTTARDEMMITKAGWSDTSEIVCYHGFQSFKHGEVTPEQAHEVGVKLAERMWGDRFQVIVATHLNTDCLHNHFVVNSVSFADGMHYHDNKANLRLLRQRSDELCREYALSVIEHPSGKKKPYALYQAEKQGRPTRDNVARQAVDEAISKSFTLKDFDRQLAEMGYRINFDPNRKYWTIIGKGWQRPKRLYKLGEEYTNDRIMERISENSYAVKFQSFSEPQVKVYRVKGSLKNARKIGGLRGLYLHYCYKLGILPKGRKQNYARLHYLLKDDLMKMEAITQETRLLCRNHIDTAEQLCSYKGSLETEMSALLQKRKELYSKSRRTSGEEKEAVKAELSDISGRLKIIRKEVRLCEGIAARSDTLKEKLQTIRADEHEQQRKELMKNEHRRRSGRTNRPNELGGL